MKLTKDKVKKAGVRIGAGLGAAGLAQAALSKSPVNRKSLIGLGATVAAGVAGSAIAKKLQNKKKAKFSSNKLTAFAKSKKETEIIGQFPKSNTKDTKKKSVFDEASDKVKNKDNLPAKSDNVPENIKTGVTSKLLMKK